MFNTLYSKLALALTIVLALVGAVFGSFSWYVGKQHADLVVQTFNRDLAANLILERKLIDNGELNEATLKETFDEYMAINPSIEIYLLNNAGQIVSHSAPPEKVVRTSVSLIPIREFLENQEYKPVVGDDPRNRERGKAFSVAPVNINSGMFGYLYVVLRGEAYDNVARTLEQQYLVKLGFQVLTMSLLVGLVAGLMILWRVTRRLRRLTLEIDRFLPQDQLVPASPGPNQGDEVKRLSLAFENMSNRISDQIRSLEQNDRKRRDLVANISHDLRTPITAILGYLETLKARAALASESELHDYVQTALRNASRMSKMIEELFELAKLEAGAAAPVMESISITDLVQDVVHQQGVLAKQNNIALSMEVPAYLPLVKADTGMIHRVLENLITNAINHLERAGEVVVCLERQADYINVSVWDSGKCIPQSEVTRLFDRFYQGDERDEREMGAGLGLSIAQQILTLHDTSIKVGDGRSGGKAFTFKLPVVPSTVCDNSAR
ncbi:MAG: HAMP domain-containing sensor histidine kinase [Arenicellales bacterium]